MAILQTARAKQLGLTESRAKSWGLNRAIFYAAAKRGFKHVGKSPSGSGAKKKPPSKTGKEYFVGNEMAYVARKGGRLYFTIGGKVQTEGDSSDRLRLGSARGSQVLGGNLSPSFANTLKMFYRPKVGSLMKCIALEGTS